MGVCSFMTTVVGKKMQSCFNVNFFGNQGITQSIWDQDTQKLIVVKSMLYFPLIPRLKRKFAFMQTASHMIFHDENKRQDVLSNHLMVKPRSTLIENIISLLLIPKMYDLAYVHMDLTHTFRLLLHHILVGL